MLQECFITYATILLRTCLQKVLATLSKTFFLREDAAATLFEEWSPYPHSSGS
jgi:hypothetical protein